MGMAAILINRPQPSEQIFNPPLTWSLKKIGPGVAEKSLKGVNGWKDDGQQVITIAHPEPSSGELQKETRGPWWPCNAHLSNIALWKPDLELIKANILIKVQNDYINK